MSSTCFISDLHLDAARPATVRALGAFLARNTHCASLYILGDLFEAWCGDDDDSPLARQVAGMLSDFRRAGPRLFIMSGNRDFLLGEHFCACAGATLLSDPTVTDLHGEPTLLMHGDSLCTADVEYQQYRCTVRDPAWQARLLERPMAERRALAAQLRAASTEANSMKCQDIMDVTANEVRAVMKAHGVRQLIHGHTHRPAKHEEETGNRWVLGAWETLGWVLEATPDGIQLNSFAMDC